MFRWGAENELIPATVYQAIATAYLDRKPDYSPEVWQECREQHEEMWERLGRPSSGSCGKSKSMGIYHIDPRMAIFASPMIARN